MPPKHPHISERNPPALGSADGCTKAGLNVTGSVVVVASSPFVTSASSTLVRPLARGTPVPGWDKPMSAGLVPGLEGPIRPDTGLDSTPVPGLELAWRWGWGWYMRAGIESVKRAGEGHAILNRAYVGQESTTQYAHIPG